MNEAGSMLSKASQIAAAFSRIRGHDVEDRTNIEMFLPVKFCWYFRF